MTFIINCGIIYTTTNKERNLIVSIASKIKGLLASQEKDLAGLASALGISKQALSNKLYRNSFSAEDLLTVAEYTGCELAFLSKNGSRTVLDSSDSSK